MCFTRFSKMVLTFMCVISIAACSNSADPKFHDEKNNVVQLSQLKGKWVIVNYWAEWCVGCVQEVPELNRFYNKDVANPKNNLVMLGVDYDRQSLDALKASINKAKIEYPVLQEDPDTAWQLGAITLLPVTFILNPEGKLAKILLGPSTEKLLLQTLHDLQAGTS
jgi:thiol-disulfide isomerase/thioredoxin